MFEAIDGSSFALRAQAQALSKVLETARPELILEAALMGLPVGEVAAVSSFGSEAAVPLHMISRIEPRTPIIFLDTGHMFPETLAYRDELVGRLGLTDVRNFAPEPANLSRLDPENELWMSDPDLCCHLRKVLPLQQALAGFPAWINGRKRHHGADRASLAVVEADGARLKFNPLATMDRAAIAAYFEMHKLPRHPLELYGFSSIGCMPCTSRTSPGEDWRAGRWRGRGKTECGLHVPAAGAKQTPTAYSSR
jgi:phosphoadenosine phosphosulfate reductase